VNAGVAVALGRVGVGGAGVEVWRAEGGWQAENASRKHRARRGANGMTFIEWVYTKILEEFYRFAAFPHLK
jgi:hypothetical protein